VRGCEDQTSRTKPIRSPLHSQVADIPPPPPLPLHCTQPQQCAGPTILPSIAVRALADQLNMQTILNERIARTNQQRLHSQQPAPYVSATTQYNASQQQLFEHNYLQLLQQPQITNFGPPASDPSQLPFEPRPLAITPHVQSLGDPFAIEPHGQQTPSIYDVVGHCL